jgi:hypothetical protein
MQHHPTRSTPRQPWALAGFVAFALLLVTAYWALARGALVLPIGPVPSWAMAVDLLLVLPLAWLLLDWRAWRQRAPRALALAGLGAVVGLWLAPPQDPLWSAIGQLRWAGLALLVAAELWLLTGLLRQLWRGRDQGLAEDVAAQALQRSFGDGVVGRLMRLESRLWIYALLRRPVQAPFAGEQHFSVHRQHGNASHQFGFVVVMAAELPIVHVLLHLGFGATVAGVVTALSAYGWLFLWAELRATEQRPLSVDAEHLHLRYGLLFDTRVPRSAVLSAEVLPPRTPAPRQPLRLRLVGMGSANVRLRLQPGTVLPLPWGDRPVEELMLGVDEPQRFVQALNPGRQEA